MNTAIEAFGWLGFFLWICAIWREEKKARPVSAVEPNPSLYGRKR